MPEYLAPGVYIEEVEIGAKPIEGVSTSTAGLLGETERGPTMPRLITGFEQFRRLYGGYVPYSYLPYSVEGFFSNGGKRCFIARIVGKNSRAATLEIAGKVEGPSSSTEIKTEPSAEPTKEPPKEPESKKKSSTGNPGGNPGIACIVNAIGPGTWGNRIAIKTEDASLSARNPKLFKLTVIYWKDELPLDPGDPTKKKRIVIDPTDPVQQKDPNRREPSLVEVYDNLSPEPSSSDFYKKKINNISSLIEIEKESAEIAVIAKELKLLDGGADGAKVELSDYKGKTEQGERTGLSAFTEVDEISILCIPSENDYVGLTDEIVKHCELMKDRFAVLQANQSAGLVSNLMPPTDSKYAAFYYPWIKVMDPLTNSPKLVPPGGHIAGIYARSDTERGVHKSPANEIVRGALGLQFSLTKEEQDILNPRGVNCIRAFRGRGIRVWGARTISRDPIWKYVNVRRLFLYLEESIEESTQWVVFEPNAQRLWARVKQSVTDFLTRVWKDGALMGTTPDEAFFVKCDETTMTPDDIDNGRLIVLIGVAPVKPAEFVIFHIAQWRGGSEITE
jgi:phage tail sheath protein FI